MQCAYVKISSVDELTNLSGNTDSLVYKAEILIERRDADALKVATQLMNEARAGGGRVQLAEANYIMAYYNCIVANNYDKAIELCEATLKNAHGKDLDGLAYKIYMTLGNAYQLKGEIFSSQHWYMKGLRIMEGMTIASTKEKLFLATFYYNLSIIFTTRELNDSGEEYLQKAIRLYEETGSSFKLSRSYSAYADILEGREEYEKAIELMHKALQLDLSGKDGWSIALTKANLGILHSRINFFGEAVSYLREALAYFESENKAHELGLVQLNLGSVICKAGNTDDGVLLLREAEKIFKRLDNKHELTKVYELLSSSMAEKGDYKMALLYHYQYSDNVKYVFDNEKVSALTRARQEFESEQREKEATLLREKNEEIRIYATSLEESNKYLEALTYSVSHDLKGPLAMIKNINALTPEDENGYHKFIDDTCKQTLDSIDGILSFSEKVNNNLLSSEYKVEAVYDVVIEKAEELKKAALANGQTIVVIKPDKELKCRINRETLGRAIANLIGNSIKFSTATGKIKVEIYSDEGDCIIKLSDEGIGIPPAMRKHLFEKFTSAQRPGLKGEKSTGLGLYITQSIIKLHGGTIEIDERTSSGTTFIIRLPLA